jgi:hypothetical protein
VSRMSAQLGDSVPCPIGVEEGVTRSGNSCRPLSHVVEVTFSREMALVPLAFKYVRKGRCCAFGLTQ